MNREEAVKWLSNLKNDLGQMQYQPLWHYAEAIDGIIEALQTPPISQRSMYQAGYRQAQEDRPRGEWTLLAEERPVDGYEIIATVYWPGYGDSTIAVGHIDRFDNWHLYSPTEGELIKGFEVIAWKTLPEPYCGADMRSE